MNGLKNKTLPIIVLVEPSTLMQNAQQSGRIDIEKIESHRRKWKGKRWNTM